MQELDYSKLPLNRVSLFRSLFGIPLTDSEIKDNKEIIERYDYMNRKRSVKSQMNEIMKRLYLEEPAYYAFKKKFPNKEVMDLTLMDCIMIGFQIENDIKLFYDEPFLEDKLKDDLVKKGFSHSRLEILYHKLSVVGFENMSKKELKFLEKHLKWTSKTTEE